MHRGIIHKKGDVMKIDDKKLAYIAGFFDGEGCVTVNGAYLTPEVSACNTDLRPLEVIRNALGGKVYPRSKQIEACKVIYGWHVHGKNAAIALAALLPYLIVKKRRALLGVKLAFAKPDDRVDLAVEIRILNKEGEK